VPSATIQQKLRVHAYDTDFRRQIAPGDYAEMFLDLREEPSGETSYGELLYTAIATGGEIYRYWRYRTPDNAVDYFDENGNNSKKFLLRRPVRGENVRLASGFGMRFHPILRQVRPHRGIDWAAPTGTPILAAGTGIVEEARYKGEYGNHIRIQHANGYHSTYSHLSRYAPRIQDGARVRQGEVIGFVGNTGLSSGPHLHFEILVNQSAVDPLSIQVPRERQLTGKVLADFQRERARIDDLMRRPPVANDTR
jgi:murein DD-endopeptidase MepM/ murein hydrolase activator NlpD